MGFKISLEIGPPGHAEKKNALLECPDFRRAGVLKKKKKIKLNFLCVSRLFERCDWLRILTFKSQILDKSILKNSCFSSGLKR